MNEIRKIYIAHFLTGLATVASVTWTLFFLSNGLNQSEIGILFATFLIVLAVCNIPTGSFADIFGHKTSVVIGLFLQSLCGLFLFGSHSMIGFMFGMIFAGLGAAFTSGALSSLIYDLLAKISRKADFHKVQGRAGAYFLIGSIVASPIGSLLYKYYPRLPNFLYFLFIFFAGCVMYLISWEFKKKPQSILFFVSKIYEGTVFTMKNRRLVGLVIIGIALTISRMVFNQNISQPYQQDIGVDVAYIGVTAAIVAAVQAFISYNSHKIYKKIGTGLSLYFIVIIPSVTALILSYMNNIMRSH